MAQDGDGWVRDVGVLERETVRGGASGRADQSSIPLPDPTSRTRNASRARSSPEHRKAAR
jgi:hypothetical protein